MLLTCFVVSKTDFVKFSFPTEASILSSEFLPFDVNDETDESLLPPVVVGFGRPVCGVFINSRSWRWTRVCTLS